MAPIKLTYFDTSGLGDSIRFLLSYGGLKFVDFRIEKEDFLTIKHSFPVGQLPVLEIDGMILYQSTAICRYLGKKLGLSGKDAKDAVMCDIMAENVTDLRVWLSMIYHEPNIEAREQKRALVLSQVKAILAKINQEALLNRGFLVGGQLTWVDFVLVGMAKYLSTMLGHDIFAGFEELNKVNDAVRNLPAVRLYLDKQQKH